MLCVSAARGGQNYAENAKSPGISSYTVPTTTNLATDLGVPLDTGAGDTSEMCQVRRRASLG